MRQLFRRIAGKIVNARIGKNQFAITDDGDGLAGIFYQQAVFFLAAGQFGGANIHLALKHAGPEDEDRQHKDQNP